MKTVAFIAVAAILIGGLYAKHEATVAFQHAAAVAAKAAA